MAGFEAWRVDTVGALRAFRPVRAHRVGAYLAQVFRHVWGVVRQTSFGLTEVGGDLDEGNKKVCKAVPLENMFYNSRILSCTRGS